MFWNKKESHMTREWKKERMRDEVILVCGKGSDPTDFRRS